MKPPYWTILIPEAQPSLRLGAIEAADPAALVTRLVATNDGKDPVASGHYHLAHISSFPGGFTVRVFKTLAEAQAASA